MIKYSLLDNEESNASKTAHIQIEEGEFQGVVFKLDKIEFPTEEELEQENYNVAIYFDVISVPESFGEMTPLEMESNPKFTQLIKEFTSDMIEELCNRSEDSDWNLQTKE